MGNYFDLIAAINAAIKTNGEQGITGASLNAILRDMVAALGAGYQYVGVVAPDAAAPSTDYNAVYLGLTAGTYTNFGGTQVRGGQFGVFTFNGSWTYNIADIASGGYVRYDVPQVMTQEQAAQARSNISAASNADVNAKYTKPSGGIPKTDLASAVQTSLDKADAALPASSVVDNLTTEDATKALSAKQGKVLDGKISQLGQEVDELTQPADTDDDFDISDEDGNMIVRFHGGEVETKEFDSAKAPQGESVSGYDLALSDENGKHIALFADGEIKTKNFDSSMLKSDETDMDFSAEDDEGNAVLGVIDGYPVTKKFNGKILAGKVEANEGDIANIQGAMPVIDPVYGWEQLDPNNPLAKIRFDAGLTSVIQHWGFIGDSLSSGCHGYDKNGGGQTGVDIYEYSWGQYICRLCGTEGYNFSFGGGAAKTWLTQAQRGWPVAQLEQNWKQAYTIAFGINDAAQILQETTMYPDGLGDADTDLVVNPLDPYDYSNNNEDSFVGCYGGIIQRLRSVNPRCRIFVLTMLDKNYTGMPIHLTMDAEIRKIAAKFDNCYVIDLATYAPQYYGSPLHDVLVYWSHLTSVGYVWLAYLINTYIDWIIRQNLYAFRDIALIGTDKYMNQNIH